MLGCSATRAPTFVRGLSSAQVAQDPLRRLLARPDGCLHQGTVEVVAGELYRTCAEGGAPGGEFARPAGRIGRNPDGPAQHPARDDLPSDLRMKLGEFVLKVRGEGGIVRPLRRSSWVGVEHEQ